ncbi:MAG: hypothetical protein C4518_02490 [Desulfobacteraceae bacterium]|nr:MAG: hypothetical protein C4518_02490 [Desulfobacteraceae bacterium]
MIATIQTHFDIPADKAWNILKQKDTFLYITRGFLGFAGNRAWPEAFSEGQEIRTRLIFFHFLPAWKHVLRVIRMDDRARELYSNEMGGAVRVWNHLIKIEPESDSRCRYTDQIDIRAGWMTLGVWLYAHVFYRYRQSRWKRLIRRKNGS